MMVAFTRPARHVWVLTRQEAERLQHHYVGPEHLLLGLLRHHHNQAARVLRAHGLDLETVRGAVDRLIARGVLPAPRPSDDALLATLGIDPVAVRRRLRESFGTEAVDQATQRVRTRPIDVVPWPPMGGTPLLAKRVFRLAYQEAVARGQEVGPEHLLLGLLGDAGDPADTELPLDQQVSAYLGLPDHAHHPVRLLVETRGLSLAALGAAVRSELDRDR
jgi:ATP-dependent Clp protease ATP-binding subunit ClpA